MLDIVKGFLHVVTKQSGEPEFYDKQFQAEAGKVLARIAKRGRKRWLGLVFVTQLPQHLPS